MSEASESTPPIVVPALNSKLRIQPPISDGENKGFLPEGHAWARVCCHMCGETFTIPIWCGERLCPVCAKERARKYQKWLHGQVKRLLGSQQRIRFVTLTVRNTFDLSSGYTNLRTAFARLRERDLWSVAVRGGCYSIEVTKGDNGWHVHLHCFYEGNYIPHDLLSSTWREVTNDESFVVDIREVRDYRSAVRELSKYPFKPADARNWSTRERREFEIFMGDRKLFNRFGCWYGSGEMCERGLGSCPSCGAVGSLYVLYRISEPFVWDGEHDTVESNERLAVAIENWGS